MLLPFIAMLVAASEPPVVITGSGTAPFISPMGEPFPSRSKGRSALASWFAGADTNRDQWLSVPELVADANRFFALLDVDGDGQIDPDEVVRYEWEIAPAIQVNFHRMPQPGEARDKRAAGKGERGSKATSLGAGLTGGGRYSLLNYPEPVTAADYDFDRSITSAEFGRAAVERFALLDRDKRGALSLVDLESRYAAMLAADAKQRKKRGLRRKSDDTADDRIAIPLPITD